MVALSVIGEPEKAGLQIISEFMLALSDSYAITRAFRGHANASWEPVPVSWRPGESGLDDHLEFGVWKKTVRRFVPQQPLNDLEFLVLAQHYGIPTALLDWTTNPLVALYFACLPVKGKDGVEIAADGNVIQFDTMPYRAITKNESVELFKAMRRQPIIIDTAFMNARTLAQDSIMTLHCPDEESLEVTPVFRIPHAQKTKVRIALHLFGMSETRIFPDLTVAAAAFKEALTINRGE